MMRPRLLLVDEISEGLQPSVIGRIAAILRAERETRGTAVLLVEQNLDFALRVADRWAVLKRGEVDDAGPSDPRRAAVSSIISACDATVRRADFGMGREVCDKECTGYRHGTC